jgi:hypothetical protein
VAESFVQLPLDGSGRKVRSFQQVVGANTVEHQGFVLCDSAGNIIDSLNAAPAGTERALPVRQVGAAPSMPASVGQKAMAASLPVAIASDQSVLDSIGLPLDQPVMSVATSAEITLPTTTGVKEVLTIWHPTAEAKSYYIFEVRFAVRVATSAGAANTELQYISAENGTPGGTALTPQAIYDRTVASNALVRQVVTGAPTVVGQIFQRKSFTQNAPGYDHSVFATTGFRDCIRLRGGVSEGLRISANVTSALTGAPILHAFARWIEF